MEIASKKPFQQFFFTRDPYHKPVAITSEWQYDRKIKFILFITTSILCRFNLIMKYHILYVLYANATEFPQ